MLIDASFREESRRRLFLDAAGRWGIPTCMLVCRADPDLVRHRLAHRHGDVSDADWSIHQEAADRWEKSSRRTSSVIREVDTGGDLRDPSAGRRNLSGNSESWAEKHDACQRSNDKGGPGSGNAVPVVVPFDQRIGRAARIWRIPAAQESGSLAWSFRFFEIEH